MDDVKKDYSELLQKAEKTFESYNTKCANVEKTYADLDTMSKHGKRKMQIFWANQEVLRPIIYARAPRPVVTSRHKDRNAVVLKTAEVLERVLEWEVEADHLHDTLTHVRDDLALGGRGVVWLADDGSVEHVHRDDFLHDPARTWSEVDWVARRVWMLPEEGRKRFGAKFTELTQGESDKDEEPTGRIPVWEVWDKSESKVIFMGGFDAKSILEVSEPLFDVDGFFPCPRPAYATLEPGSLQPVPDIVFYKDQLDEINELTDRIAALSKNIRMKGFYASGVSEVGEAIEAAMRRTDNDAILVPVSNLGSLGGSTLSQSVVWMPVREVAQTIADLIKLRAQMIQDVYEITGLSDIMRGATAASETATAQSLKAQYGSVRVRERQSEMVRIARDAVALKAEIIAESRPVEELLTISGITDLPTLADIQAEIIARNQAIVAQGGQPQAPDLSDVPMVETVGALLRDQRIRPFTLSIETDSTIQPDEQAEKQSRIEFTTAMGTYLREAVPAVQQAPIMAPMLVEFMRFTASGFRAGRELSDVIDQFAEQVLEEAEKAQQPQEPQVDPKVQMDGEKLKADIEKMKAEVHLEAQKAMAEIEKTRAETAKIMAEVEALRSEQYINSMKMNLVS